MEAVANTLSATAATPTPSSDSFADMGTDDFLNLLLTQLTNQDPLEPVGNQELLDQISSIREIELSTTLTQSLQALTGQQRFAGASALIGQYVSGANADGTALDGVVAAVRFTPDGSAVLQLTNGQELPVAQLVSVMPPQTAAESLVGLHVAGVDRRDLSAPKAVEGVVSSVRTDDAGQVVLELDTGEDLRLADVLEVSAQE